jgi:hypothetical protein
MSKRLLSARHDLCLAIIHWAIHSIGRKLSRSRFPLITIAPSRSEQMESFTPRAVFDLNVLLSNEDQKAFLRLLAQNKVSSSACHKKNG